MDDKVRKFFAKNEFQILFCLIGIIYCTLYTRASRILVI